MVLFTMAYPLNKHLEEMGLGFHIEERRKVFAWQYKDSNPKINLLSKGYKYFIARESASWFSKSLWKEKQNC